MRDFFVVSHKYATNIPSTESSDPNLFTKCWHLNNAIKRLLQLATPTPTGDYSVTGDTLYMPNTDDVASAVVELNSGKGVVSSDILDLDR